MFSGVLTFLGRLLGTVAKKEAPVAEAAVEKLVAVEEDKVEKWVEKKVGVDLDGDGKIG